MTNIVLSGIGVEHNTFKRVSSFTNKSDGPEGEIKGKGMTGTSTGTLGRTYRICDEYAVRGPDRNVHDMHMTTDSCCCQSPGVRRSAFQPRSRLNDTKLNPAHPVDGDPVPETVLGGVCICDLV